MLHLQLIEKPCAAICAVAVIYALSAPERLSLYPVFHSRSGILALAMPLLLLLCNFQHSAPYWKLIRDNLGSKLCE
jgi:hypothetical protein